MGSAWLLTRARGKGAFCGALMPSRFFLALPIGAMPIAADGFFLLILAYAGVKARRPGL
jgi:hypothetical protein